MSWAVKALWGEGGHTRRRRRPWGIEPHGWEGGGGKQEEAGGGIHGSGGGGALGGEPQSHGQEGPPQQGRTGVRPHPAAVRGWSRLRTAAGCRLAHHNERWMMRRVPPRVSPRLHTPRQRHRRATGHPLGNSNLHAPGAPLPGQQQIGRRARRTYANRFRGRVPAARAARNGWRPSAATTGAAARHRRALRGPSPSAVGLRGKGGGPAMAAAGKPRFRV